MTAALRHSRSTTAVIVALTFAAPFLGGSIALWAKATIALLSGLLLIIVPPRRSAGRGLNFIFCAVALLSFLQFLPAAWFPTPAWRATLIGLGVQLPSTVSPQPWLTLEATCLLWLGLAWAYYLFTYDWDETRSREFAWDAYCLGILILSALLVIAYALKWRIPFWPNVLEFGFFPNRNQTSNVLGIGGIMVYANAFHNLEQGHRRGWFWLTSLGLICWALILNYSRGGIILFFAGTLIWHIWWLVRSETRESTPPFITWAPLVILIGLLLFAGGETWLRFKNSSQLISTQEAGRLLIQRDALTMLQTSPVLGVGLGNFRSLFSAHRHFFVSDSEAIHPESDWLWLGTEMGIIAPLLILGGFGLWIVRCFPFAPGTWRGLRRAAMIAGIAFAVHGVLDVSGHRVGAVWPALFLAATALHPQRSDRSSGALPILFRCLGAIFVIIGFWWFTSLTRAAGPPTTATVQRLINRIPETTDAEDFQQLLDLSNHGLEVAPLNWIMYYNRGLAETRLHSGRDEITRDFAVARFLMPNWPDLYLKQGAACLFVDEVDIAFSIWNEGLDRLSNPAAFYADLYGLVKDNADLRDRWRELGMSNKRCVLIFLSNATPAEFQFELSRILTENPELRDFEPAELKRLFQLWYEKGEKLSLAETLRSHPKWESIAWYQLARVYADYQDYRPAYEKLREHAGATLPDVPPNEPVETLATRFRLDGNENDGLKLARAQAARGEIDDALAVITVLTSRSRPSPFVHYVEAGLWARKENWSKAWQAMWKYVEQAKLAQ
ncbi:MAG TPA: O-antigen ligase family protein [Chthoniobacterales bacterium]|nr:O-antigen ligase family protein [Chthoniobacterales bacterium]